MSTPTPTKEAPLLPPAPWYESEVQVRAVIALGAQLISILFRALGRYTDINIGSDQIDAVVADLTQGAAIVFGLLAVLKRKDSEVQPLTLTAGAAAAKASDAQLNPVTLQKKQGGFARPYVLAILLAVSAPVVVLPLAGCQTVQTMSFDQRLKFTIDTHTAVTRSVTSALNAHLISSADADAYNRLAMSAREILNTAVRLKDSDISTAEGQLQLANDVLIELQEYLIKRGAQS